MLAATQELIPDPIAVELPSVPMRVRTTTWGVIRQIAATGRSFTASEVRAIVRGKIAGGERAGHYVHDLAAAGHLRRVDTAIGLDRAVYRLDSDQAPAPAIKGQRPEPVAFHVGSLNIQIPRTHDGIWMLLRWMDANRGGFSPSWLRTLIGDNIEWEAVAAYVKALERGGYVARAGGVAHDPIYRLAKWQPETPILRADGAVVAAAQRADHLWRAIKMLGLFNARDLAASASLPEWPISDEQAARYAGDLARAGYLLERHDDRGAVWRLKRRMNTGPAAPRVLRARFVWDPNLARVVGDSVMAEEARR